MINWKCTHTWKTARINTLWCLVGCSIGDFGTILYFQNIQHDWTTFQIMTLAIINGLITLSSSSAASDVYKRQY